MAHRMNISMDRVGQFVECSFKIEPNCDDATTKSVVTVAAPQKLMALSSSGTQKVAGDTSPSKIPSPKMPIGGSRRIFTPQFKLQVLDSYRSDPDCKGNQRATSRKYGIHRRQIQKWLQCEANLRQTVSNGGKNSSSKVLSSQGNGATHQNHVPQQQNYIHHYQQRQPLTPSPVSYHHPIYNNQHHQQIIESSRIHPAVKSTSNTCQTVNKLVINDGYGSPAFSSPPPPINISSMTSTNSYLLTSQPTSPSLTSIPDFPSSSTSSSQYNSTSNNNNSLVQLSLSTTCLTNGSKSYTTNTSTSHVPHQMYEQQQQFSSEICYNRIPSSDCSNSNTNCSYDNSNNYSYLTSMMSPPPPPPPSTTSSVNQPIDLSLQKLESSSSHHQNNDRTSNTEITPKPIEWHNHNNNVEIPSSNSTCTIKSEAWDLSCRKRHLSSSLNSDCVDKKPSIIATQPKAVKLFKPYLLDNKDDDDDDDKEALKINIKVESSKDEDDKNNDDGSSKKEEIHLKNQDSVIWRNHIPSSTPPHVYDTYLYPSQESTYPSNFYTYPISYDVTSYWCVPSTSPPSLSQTPIATAASPISGYESSTSTFSDVSDPYHLPPSPISSSYHHRQQYHYHHLGGSIYDTKNHHHHWIENTAKFQHNMILTN